MASIFDGHTTQTGDRLTTGEVQDFRDTVRRARRTASVPGMTVETTHGGTNVLLDDTIRNPDHINDWFLGMIVPRPTPPEGQAPTFPALHGAMYYVAELVDDSVDADHIALTELQAQLNQWLFGFSEVVPPGQTESPRDKQRELTGPARFVVATNLAEMSVHFHFAESLEPDGASLPDGTIVKVFMGQSLDGRPRYYFSQGGRGLIQQFRLLAVTELFLVCAKWDGQTGSEPVNVWKPWELRTETLDPGGYVFRGREYKAVGTQERTEKRLSDNVIEHQMTSRPYHGEPDGDILYGIFKPLGGIASHMPQDNYANIPGAEWLDINVGGRAWAKVST